MKLKNVKKRSLLSRLQLILLAVSKDEWDTKKDTGKHCNMPKSTSQAKASKTIKPIALGVTLF